MQNESHLLRLQARLTLLVLFLCSILFLTTQAALAASISEYQQNLQKAITALDTLTQSDEEETQASYEGRFADTLTAVRTALPSSQMVECGTELCSVDNSWLHEQLTELEKASDADWFYVLTHIIEHLRAIEERVKEFQQGQIKDWNKETAKERLAGILDRPEYATRGKASSALSRILDAIARWIAKFFGRQVSLDPTRGSSITFILQWLVIALAVGVLLYVLKLLVPKFRRQRKKRQKVKVEPRIVLGERLEPEASAVDLLAEAEALARTGEIRAAIRKAYIALLVELGDRKIISLAQHKTNRDYLRSVRHVQGLHPVMSILTDSFERHWYGFSQAEPADWNRFRDGYKAALQTRT